MSLKAGKSGTSLSGPRNRMCKGPEDRKGMVHGRNERVGGRGRNKMSCTWRALGAGDRVRGLL